MGNLDKRSEAVALMYAILFALIMALAISWSGDTEARSGPARSAPCGGRCIVTPQPAIVVTYIGPGWLWRRLSRWRLSRWWLM